MTRYAFGVLGVTVFSTLVLSNQVLSQEDQVKIAPESEGVPFEAFSAPPDADSAPVCAGEYTRCIGVISGESGQMTVRQALNSEACWNLANMCRHDVQATRWYSSSVLICAPYEACDVGLAK